MTNYDYLADADLLHEEQGQVLRDILFTRVKAKGEPRVLTVGPDTPADIMLHDAEDPDCIRFQSGLIAYIAEQLNVYQESVSAWISGEAHLPNKYLAALSVLLQLSDDEKRNLYTAVIVPSHPGTVDDVFAKLGAHMIRLKPMNLFRAVHHRCCTAPSGEITTWNDMMQSAPVDTWPQYKPLEETIFSNGNAPGGIILEALGALPPVRKEHVFAYLRAFMLPREKAPNFGPGTEHKTSGDIMLNLMATHALDWQGHVRTWQSIYDEAVEKNDPSIFAAAKKMTEPLLVKCMEQRIKSSKADTTISHQTVNYWVTKGSKPREPLKTMLFDLFNLTEEQRKIYNEAPTFACREYRDRAWGME